MASITTWHRLTPISRSADFATAIAAELHDPMWMLARQHQIGELRGEDTGSPAFVRIGYKAAPLVDLVLGTSAPVPLDPAKPIEAQILPEPFTPDLATRVELSLTFFQILGEAFGARAGDIKTRFQSVAELRLQAPNPNDAPFDPIDEGTSAFTLMTVGQALDGVQILTQAQNGTIPDAVNTILSAGERQTMLAAYKAFARWVASTFGAIGPEDPKGWNPQRLDYDVKMRFGDAASSVTLDVHPSENGSVDWTSFDLEATANQPFNTVAVQVAREIPSHVRFQGMPAPRYWDFESGDLPWPDVDTTRTELARLLVIDFAMLYAIDMFVVPLELDVGTAVAIDSLLVYDVFGGRTIVDPVEAGRTQVTPPQLPDRFTMYTTAAPGGTVANFMVLPPGAGRALQHGPVLEEVRFARDEAANMAWGIEAATPSRIGELRRGSERDAAVDAAIQTPPPPPTDAPLRYQVESKVPVHWIPFLLPNTGGAPTTVLEKGAIARFDGTKPAPVPAVSKVLNPFGATGYTVFEEQVSRSGARVERLVFSARARDGKSHLWVARRTRAGSGETQSGLRFDAALSTET